MTLTCDELFARLDLDPSTQRWPDVTGVNTLWDATESDLCFAETADQQSAAAASKAAVVLVPLDFPDTPGARLARVNEPRRVFFAIAETFQADADFSGIHADACIDHGARLGTGVIVAPGAVIAANVSVGNGTYVGPGVYLGPGVTVGCDCCFHSNVSVQRETMIGDRCTIHSGTNIGGDGFGYQWDGTEHRKVPQLGRVVIEDDVEIGCNVCIDRATLGTTRIGRGSKIDNLVQVAHNVDIGEHVILVSQCGIAGSTRIGGGTVVAGQAAISDHLEVGAGARIGGQAGVTKNVASGETITGTPARSLSRTLREHAALGRLPEMARQLKRQQRLIEALEAQLARLEHSQDAD